MGIPRTRIATSSNESVTGTIITIRQPQRKKVSWADEIVKSDKEHNSSSSVVRNQHICMTEDDSNRTTEEWHQTFYSPKELQLIKNEIRTTVKHWNTVMKQRNKEFVKEELQKKGIGKGNSIFTNCIYNHQEYSSLLQKQQQQVADDDVREYDHDDDDDTVYCIRGIEHLLTKSSYQAWSIRRKVAVKAVLLEQAVLLQQQQHQPPQRRRRINNNTNSNNNSSTEPMTVVVSNSLSSVNHSSNSSIIITNNTTNIQSIYEMLSHPSKVRALKRGHDDAVFASATATAAAMCPMMIHKNHISILLPQSTCTSTTRFSGLYNDVELNASNNNNDGTDNTSTSNSSNHLMNVVAGTIVGG